MNEGIAFDIIIAPQEILGNDDVVLENRTILYPNPATDFVTIATQDEISSIVIYNVLGQEVMQIEGDSNNMRIDISNLATGNYVTKVQVGSSVKTLKLIKTK